MAMLLGFAVQNFKSFKDMQKISFYASNNSYKKEHILPVDNYRVLRSGLVYGGNASGKTNLIKAFDFTHNIILHGLESVDLLHAHFRIDSDYYLRPGVFEYRILVGNREYSYGLVISYLKKCILSEWLIRLGNVEKYIFNRSFSGNISKVETEIADEIGNENDSKRFSIYLNDFSNFVSEALQKKTILSDLAIRGKNTDGVFKEITDIYDFFKNFLIIYPNTKYAALSSLASNDELNEKFTKMLEHFDTGIKRLDCKRQAVEFDELFGGLPKNILEKMKISISNELGVHNSILKLVKDRLLVFKRDENGNVVTEKLVLDHGNRDDLFDLKDESDGTRRLFDLLPLLTFEGSATIFIDEIDRSIHPSLIIRFLSLFYKHAEINKSLTQLLATTHNMNLFDTDLVRLDELWLVKRKTDQSSIVYSLNKYDIGSTDNIKNGYLLGKYGAIPDIADEEVLLEDISHAE